jgi:ankyrin repeat protein
MLFELLSHGADPKVKDPSGESPLFKILVGGFESLEKHRRDALALLLYHGADVNTTPFGKLNKPIHLAVRRQDPWAVAMLLENKALVDEKNSAGNTPLALAVNS